MTRSHLKLVHSSSVLDLNSHSSPTLPTHPTSKRIISKPISIRYNLKLVRNVFMGTQLECCNLFPLLHRPHLLTLILSRTPPSRTTTRLPAPHPVQAVHSRTLTPGPTFPNPGPSYPNRGRAPHTNFGPWFHGYGQMLKYRM